MKYVQLSNGEKIAYKEKGTGENVLIALHTNMTTSLQLEALLNLASSNLRVILPDLRGFGKSSYNKKVNGLDEYANDIIDFIDQLSINEFSLLGWGLGGGVAMEISATLPEKVKRLILVSTIGVTGYPMLKVGASNPPTLEDLYRTREEVENDSFRTKMIEDAIKSKDKEFFKEVLESTIYSNGIDEQLLDDYASDLLSQKSIADVYYSYLTFNISDKHNGVLRGNFKIHDIKSKTLIIHGLKDAIMPVSMSKSVNKYLNNNSELILGDFGHSPFIEKEKWLLSIVNYFINN